MENSYYLEQLALQQNICRYSRILSVVCLLAALVLVSGGLIRKKRSRRIFRTVSMGAMLLLLGVRQTAASPWQGEAVTSAQIQLVQGTPAGGPGTYASPVMVQVHWWTGESAGNRDPLLISYRQGGFSESLQLDPGYGTSVTAQLQSLGISWIRLVSESGTGESAEGKILTFLASAEGSYYFESAGAGLNVSIGSETAAGGEPAGADTGRAAEEQAADNVTASKGSEDAEMVQKTAAEKEAERLSSDTDAPEIKLKMDLMQGKEKLQIAAERSMTILVSDENFDFTAEPEVETTVKSGYRFSGWKQTGSGAEGTISFIKDGQYKVNCQWTDLAGNQSEKVSSGSFLLDQTSPEIRIQGVTDRAAYDRLVYPVIQVEDLSFSADDLSCSLIGARSGSLDVEGLSDITWSENGTMIAMTNLPAEQDDVYTLSVRSSDLAGNTAEENVIFSIDQYGSSYILSDETQELVDAYYTAEPIDLVLSEVNTSPVVYQVSVTRDGVPLELQEEKDFSVEVRGGDGEWMIYIYRIFASVFSEEGVYHVDLTSRDQASNVNDSQARGVRIDFAVDQTPPVLLVWNLEDGAVYREEQHSFTVRSSDKTKLTVLRVLVDGEVVSETEAPGEEETILLQESEGKQSVQILAEDEAGNRIASEEYTVTVNRSADPSEQTSGGKPDSTVSAGRRRNLPAAGVVLLLTVAAAGGAGTMVMRKRK
ncbi:MAG: Ig-like domain-containing protein [Lachnospiraceae bacterium]|nr:Ig-like domain-containing protein [Lachnospiraceae bacterium]